MNDYSTAACVGHPPEWWMPDTTGDVNYYRRAKAICATCPIRTRCLADAMRAEASGSDVHRHGLWGGLTPAERATLARGAACAAES